MEPTEVVELRKLLAAVDARLLARLDTRRPAPRDESLLQLQGARSRILGLLDAAATAPPA